MPGVDRLDDLSLGRYKSDDIMNWLNALRLLLSLVCLHQVRKAVRIGIPQVPSFSIIVSYSTESVAMGELIGKKGGIGCAYSMYRPSVVF